MSKLNIKLRIKLTLFRRKLDKGNSYPCSASDDSDSLSPGQSDSSRVEDEDSSDLDSTEWQPESPPSAGSWQEPLAVAKTPPPFLGLQRLTPPLPFLNMRCRCLDFELEVAVAKRFSLLGESAELSSLSDDEQEDSLFLM